jgi:hypothetical protein
MLYTHIGRPGPPGGHSDGKCLAIVFPSFTRGIFSGLRSCCGTVSGVMYCIFDLCFDGTNSDRPGPEKLHVLALTSSQQCFADRCDDDA